MTDDRSALDIICDADYHTRELAMIAGLKADGIDIGPPTRQHFTLEDCQAMAVRS